MSDKSHVGMSRCFYCGDFSEVLLDKFLRYSLPRDCGVINMRPRTKCEGWMQEGIILIGYDEEATNVDEVERSREQWRSEHVANGGREAQPGTPTGSSYERKMRAAGQHPWEFIPAGFVRTGQFAVVRDEFCKRNFGETKMTDRILRMRWTFMPSQIMEQVIGESPTEQDNE